MNVMEIFLQANAIRIGGRYEIFKNTYAPLHVDFTALLDKPRYFDMLTDALANEVREINPDKVVGAFTSGIPLATAISLKTNLPMAFVRREPAYYGTQKTIEGNINEDDMIVLVDDVFSKVENNEQYIKYIREKNKKPIIMLVVFNYNMLSPIKLQRYNVNLLSLFSSKELLNKLEKWGKISRDEKEKMLKELKKCGGM